MTSPRRKETAVTERKTTRIPFSRVAVMGRELEYVREAIANRHLAGDGTFTKRCQDFLRRRFDVPSVLLTTSCTHALEMIALLLDIEPGDEVIIPSFTFVSTANAFVLRGATPVFIDSRADTMNIDERQLKRLITKRTRAIVVVHYAGIACAMDEILAVAGAHDIAVVEDNAHGIFGAWNGRPLGTFGSMSAASFHDTKNFSSGEGGALFLNDSRYVERAEIIREKGTDRSRFFRGQVDKYTWVDVGSSYLPSELVAAFLLGQLECENAIQNRRRRIWETYHAELASWAERLGIRQPTVPPGAEPSWHLYYLVMRSLEDRQAFIAYLRSRDMAAVFHYLPLHRSAMGTRAAPKVPELPVADAAGDTLVRLPMYNDMTDAELQEVVETVRSWK